MKRSKSPEKRAKKAELKEPSRPRCPDCGAYLRKDGDT